MNERFTRTFFRLRAISSIKSSYVFHEGRVRTPKIKRRRQIK